MHWRLLGLSRCSVLPAGWPDWSAAVVCLVSLGVQAPGGRHPAAPAGTASSVGISHILTQQPLRQAPVCSPGRPHARLREPGLGRSALPAAGKPLAGLPSPSSTALVLSAGSQGVPGQERPVTAGICSCPPPPASTSVTRACAGKVSAESGLHLGLGTSEAGTHRAGAQPGVDPEPLLAGPRPSPPPQRATGVAVVPASQELDKRKFCFTWGIWIRNQDNSSLFFFFLC